MIIKVTMYPDISGWEPDDLRWVAGYHGGLFRMFSFDQWRTAGEYYNDAFELGFTVSMEFID